MIYTFVRQAELARLTGAARTAALRLNICSMIQYAGGGHLGSSLSSLRIYESLVATTEPSLLVPSKGHDVAAMYVVMHARGVGSDVDLLRFRQPNGFTSHPERGSGWIVSTGSLGMGLSKAVGLALADRTRRVYCVVGDGEMQEGQVWEAACHAARARLDNLTVLIDANGYQSEGPILQPQDREPFGPFKAACWTCQPVSYGDPIPTVFAPGWPTVLLCHTKKGDGVPHWSHSGALEPEQYTANVLYLGQRLSPDLMWWVDGPDHAGPVRSDLVFAFRSAMLQRGQHSDLVVLDADLAWDAGLDGLREDRRFPLEPVGIAEQHMVSCAVGLAAAGKQPVCHTFARFFTRATEQIRDALNEPGLAIRFVGTLAGPLNVGPGPSHETDFDLAVFRQGPCRIYEPHTPEEVGQAVEQMFKDPVSSYLRLLARPVRGYER